MLITNIQRFSLDDGHGIRTTVFLAGCNMKCLWCHNPETINKHWLMYDKEKCLFCGLCEKSCNKGFHKLNYPQHSIYYHNACLDCTACVDLCPSGALKINSIDRTVDEVLQEIMKDFHFYRQNGGVTIGGGEPLCQVDELSQLLLKCKENSIHTALETAANVSFDVIEKIIDTVDLFIIDCKAYTRELHQYCTGQTNDLILENIRQISKIKDIWVRIPVIENVNITLDEMKKIGAFLQNIQFKKVELLSYHKMGIKKYELCGMNYTLKHINEPSRQFMLNCLEILDDFGVHADWSGL